MVRIYGVDGDGWEWMGKTCINMSCFLSILFCRARAQGLFERRLTLLDRLIVCEYDKLVRRATVTGQIRTHVPHRH